MSIEIVNMLPETAWSTFVAQLPQGNIFHTPEMFRVFARTKGYLPELWAAVNNNQILALMVPVHVSLLEGILHILTTRTVVYGSVLSVPGAEGDQALKLLLQEYKHNSGKQSLFTELRNVYPLGTLSAIVVQEGFSYEDHLNYLINLNRPVETVFQSIGKRTRKNIKNGLNKAIVSIEEVGNRSDLPACYRLLDMTYRVAHVPLADYSLFEAAFDILSPKRMIRFTVAKVNDQAVATSIELQYKGVLYGWYGGMDRTYTSYVPNELLMWHILKWGSENGYHLYDFGGAGKPEEEYGVRDFKAKFGGSLVCYGRNTYVHMPGVLWLSTQGYQLMRHLFNGRLLN